MAEEANIRYSFCVAEKHCRFSDHKELLNSVFAPAVQRRMQELDARLRKAAAAARLTQMLGQEQTNRIRIDFTEQ